MAPEHKALDELALLLLAELDERLADERVHQAKSHYRNHTRRDSFSIMASFGSMIVRNCDRMMSLVRLLEVSAEL